MGPEWSWGIEPAQVWMSDQFVHGKWTGLICENDGEPGCMGTPTALLHTELVDSQEYLPGSEIIYFKRSEDLKKDVYGSN